MSWEITITSIYCPCKKGGIRFEDHSPDNMWSKSYCIVTMQCDECEKIWRMNSRDVFIHIEDEKIRHDFYINNIKQIDDEVSAAESRMAKRFADTADNLSSFKTKKEEFEFLKDLLRYSYGTYCKERRSQSFGRIFAGIACNKPNWFNENAVGYGELNLVTLGESRRTQCKKYNDLRRRSFTCNQLSDTITFSG